MPSCVRLPFAVCLAAVSFFISVRPSAGQHVADTSDGQSWIQAIAVGPVSENWRAHLEVQPRWFSDVSELGLVIVRGAVGRRILPRTTAWLGYAHVPRTQGAGTQHEQRVWQQLSLDIPPAGRWNSAGRIRLEQRWLSPWDNSSHRLRLMIRTERPLGRDGWTLAFYDETMLTLDATARGPNRGYDRNRSYGGVQRRIFPRVVAELGYLWENSTIRGPEQRNDHAVIGTLHLGLFRTR
jgi:hypothetical protein